MKKSLTFILSLFSFFYPIYAQYTLYQGELMGGSKDDVATCVWVFSDYDRVYPFVGGYYQSEDGDFSSNNGVEDCFVTGFDINQFTPWTTVFGGSQHDYLYDILNVNGNTYVVGASDSNDFDITGNHGDKDFLVAKLDSYGQLLWTKSFGGSGTDIATSIAFLDNNLWVLGYSNSSDGDVTANYGDYDLWLTKLDMDGNLLWQKNYGGSGDDRSSDMDLSFDNNLQGSGLILSGYSKSSDGDLTLNHGDYDYWLVSIDTTGSIIYQQSFGGSGADIKPKISTSSRSSIDIVGSSNSTDGDITNPLGGYDVWWITADLYSNSINIYRNTNVGGSDDDFGTGVLNFPISCSSPTIFITFNSKSSDGDTYINHGGFDAWFLYEGFYGGTGFFNFGGQGDDEFLGMNSLFDMNNNVYDFNKYAYFVGKSDSADLSGTIPHGQIDAWQVSGDYLIQGISEYAINVKIFPIPVTNQLKIQVEEGQIKTLWLYDMTGKLLFHNDLKLLSDTYILNLPELKIGNYWLKITTDKGMAIKKITKI